jgi:hypothetical protein
VEPGCTTIGAASNSMGHGRVRRAAVGAPYIALSPRFIGWSLKWSATVERCSYKGGCGCVMVVVWPVRMLFGGDSFQRAVVVS